MKSVIASFAVAVLAGLADAKASFTNTEYDVQAGQSFTLTWQGGEGPYTILLKDGPSTDLSTAETLVSSTTGDSATFTLPASLTSGDYAFEIVDAADGESNYSVQFPFVGSAAASTTATVATTATATSTMASSTATATSTVTSATTTATESSSAASTSASASGSASTSASASGSTSGSASTTMSKSTTSSSSTHTSSSTSATATPVSVNAAGKAVPFLGGLILAAGIAAF